MTPNKCKCNMYPYISRIIEPMWGYSLGYYVLCENCGKSGPIKLTSEEAVNAWNKEENNK